MRVLVPEGFASLVSEPGAIEAISYRSRALPFAARVRRRLRGLDPMTSLTGKLALPTPAELAEVEALWLSEQVALSTVEWALLLDRLPALRWVYSQRTSTHHLDLASFGARNVALSNSGPLVSRWVAEFAFAALVSERKRIATHVRAPHPQAAPTPGRPFLATRVTILGTGRIGAELAAMCAALGMEATGLSRNPDRFGTPPLPYARVVRLDGELREVLSTSDFLVVAVPSSAETRGIVGSRELSQLPASASLISVTHPEVIDQKALFAALRAGRLASAYLDRVRPFRPLPGRRVPNLVLTHNSSAHLPEKAGAAAAAFRRGLEALGNHREPADRIV